MRFARAVFTLLALAFATAQAQPDQRPPAAWLDPDRSEPPGMKYRTFPSRLAGGEVSYLIYLPPEYGSQPGRRFPVLYWLHGRGGNQRGSGWVAQRLDKAIREGRAPAMILVGVNGLPFSSYVDSADGKSPVQSVLVKELIPHVDQTWRTIPRREGRAIEGFSMGGAGAPKIAFRFPDLFVAVSILAGALHDADSIAQRGDTLQTIYGGSREYFDANSPWTLAQKSAAAIRGRTFVRIAVGDKDGLLDRNRNYHALLDRLGIAHSFTIIEGVAHNGPALYDGMRPDHWRFFERAFAPTRSP